MKILVMDDELTARTVGEVLLSAYGTCDVAEDGPQGLALYKQALAEGEPYGLITVDILMPGMTGQEVVKQIRRHEEEHSLDPVKIVMVTGKSDLENMSTSFWQGCQRYVVKPLTANNLQETMDKLFVEPERKLA